MGSNSLDRGSAFQSIDDVALRTWPPRQAGTISVLTGRAARACPAFRGGAGSRRPAIGSRLPSSGGTRGSGWRARPIPGTRSIADDRSEELVAEALLKRSMVRRAWQVAYWRCSGKPPRAPAPGSGRPCQVQDLHRLLHPLQREVLRLGREDRVVGGDQAFTVIKPSVGGQSIRIKSLFAAGPAARCEASPPARSSPPGPARPPRGEGSPAPRDRARHRPRGPVPARTSPSVGWEFGSASK